MHAYVPFTINMYLFGIASLKEKSFESDQVYSKKQR
jgi:hypothetical protein